MAKEFRVSFDRLKDPQTITRENIGEFKKRGLDIHVDEVEEIIDDEKKQERIYKVKNSKYFGPWSKRGRG